MTDKREKGGPDTRSARDIIRAIAWGRNGRQRDKESDGEPKGDDEPPVPEDETARS